MMDHPVLALERAAMARWCNGDPQGFVDLFDNDVVYFDPTMARRVDGRTALAGLYTSWAGTIYAARHEFINPLVQEIGDAAVLTFNFVSWDGDGNALRWNCTEVFRRRDEGWRLVQSHWSITEAGIPAPQPYQL
jgi:ketosteroid isomerase-like protein